MISGRVLLDTGPLVAISSEDDIHHERCIAQLIDLMPPLLTPWPVLTEAHWLLRRDSRAIDRMFICFQEKLFKLAPVDESALPWLRTFLRRYQKIGADFADASLVYLAETEDIGTVFTLDRRDFHVYRYGKNRSLTIIPEAIN